MHRRTTILIIDDEADTRFMLERILALEGFEVLQADDALTGLRTAYRYHPDLILLDIMMPQLDGYEICRRLREVTNVPIIFVTAKAGVEEIVQGFSVGADDYITKPFEISELKCRLIRCLKQPATPSENSSELIFPTPSVMLDCARHELLLGKRTLYFTPKEFEVLRMLIRHHGKVLSPEAILTQVWGIEHVGEFDLVKQYIYRLRRKIETDPESPRYIHTVWGGGYYFEADPMN